MSAIRSSTDETHLSQARKLKPQKHEGTKLIRKACVLVYLTRNSLRFPAFSASQQWFRVFRVDSCHFVDRAFLQLAGRRSTNQHEMHEATAKTQRTQRKRREGLSEVSLRYRLAGKAAF